MNDRELMQQALDALNLETPVGAYFELKNALRYRIRQPEQEPVAYRYKMPVEDDCWVYNFCQFPDDKSNPILEPLYTTPPQRKPLTEEEIEKIAKPFWDGHLGYGYADFDSAEFAKAVETAHGIKP